jgi:DNA-binding NtrC family response regulator
MNSKRLLTDSSSPGFRSFLETIATVASSDVTVLLSGEIGVGKSVIARQLHAQGMRSIGPIVEVSLAAVSPSLLESELFGHVKGAFTDARKERLGCFRRAEGGTLVLEDIDLMAPEVQVKLLRSIQERVVEPVGGEGPIPVDVRLIATSGRDLASLVSTGEFREDLFYRLAVLPLEVPPLRARLEDLEALCENLILRLYERLDLGGARPPAGGLLTPEALDRLRAHPWPGNVRELENSLERALVLGSVGADGPIGAGLRLGPESFAFLDEAVAGVREELAERALAHGLNIEELSTAMMEASLKLERGNVSAAARRLGITRRALEYRTDPQKGAESKRSTKSAPQTEEQS